MPRATRFDFGAVARCTTAWARLSCASGRPDELDGAGGGVGHDEAHRVGHADVLAGEDDEAAGDEAGVLAGLEHAGQPVEGGVGVGAADALDERGDRRRSGRRGRSAAPGCRGRPRRGRAATWRPAPPARATATSTAVSTWRPSPPARSTRRSTASSSTVAPSASTPRRTSDAVGRRASSGLEAEQRRAAEQRRVDLEVRVLGRGADEGEQAGLDRRQQRVLLGLVEAVDLVEEQDRALAVLAEPLLGPGEHLAHVLHAGAHRRQALEGPLGRRGDQLGERRLARAGRAPQDRPSAACRPR